MALTRKFLTALGIDAEKIDEIIEAHTDTVNALKEERDSYKADAEALPAITKERDELKEAADKNKDNPYKAQYEDLKKEYEDYKADVDAKAKLAKQTAAYKAMLKKAGVSEKRIDSILKVSDVKSLEFDDKGEVKDADKTVEAIKAEWADFIVKEGTKGASTETPPENNGGNGSGSTRAAEVAARFYKNTYGGKAE